MLIVPPTFLHARASIERALQCATNLQVTCLTSQVFQFDKPVHVHLGFNVNIVHEQQCLAPDVDIRVMPADNTDNIHVLPLHGHVHVHDTHHCSFMCTVTKGAYGAAAATERRHAITVGVTVAGVHAHIVTMPELLRACHLPRTLTTMTRTRHVYTSMCISHCGKWLALVPETITASPHVHIVQAHDIGAAAAALHLPLPATIHQITCCFTAVPSLLVCAVSSSMCTSFLAHFSIQTLEKIREFRAVPRGARWIAAPRNQPEVFVVGNCFGKLALVSMTTDVILREFATCRICWGLAAQWYADTRTLHVMSHNDSIQLTSSTIMLDDDMVASSHTCTTITVAALASSGRKMLTAMPASNEFVIVSTACSVLPVECVTCSVNKSSRAYMLPCIKRPVRALSACEHALFILDDGGTRVCMLH